MRVQKFTEEDDLLIFENYGDKNCNWSRIFPDYSERQVLNRAYYLGLKRSMGQDEINAVFDSYVNKRVVETVHNFSDEEEQLIISNYSNNDTDWNSLLPDIEIKDIERRAKELGLAKNAKEDSSMKSKDLTRTDEVRKWSRVEDMYLEKEFPVSGLKAFEDLDNKSEEECVRHAIEIGVATKGVITEETLNAARKIKELYPDDYENKIKEAIIRALA